MRRGYIHKGNCISANDTHTITHNQKKTRNTLRRTLLASRGQTTLQELEVDAREDTLAKIREVREETLGGVEVAVLATLAVVDNLSLDSLALVRQLDVLVARAVATALGDGNNQVLIRGGGAAAGGVIEHAARVPGEAATAALLDTILSGNARLELVRASRSLSGGQASHGQSSNENSSELHLDRVLRLEDYS